MCVCAKRHHRTCIKQMHVFRTVDCFHIQETKLIIKINWYVIINIATCAPS